MKTRDPKKMSKVLKNKGFVLDPSVDHHKYFNLVVDGVKTDVQTYISHGKMDYGKSLMGKVKKQLKFTDNSKLDNFLDCPMSREEYINMLVDVGELEEKFRQNLKTVKKVEGKNTD